MSLRRLPVRVDSAGLEAQYVGAEILTDGVMIWFILDDSGLHLRCRYPDTPEARAGVGAWQDALVARLQQHAAEWTEARRRDHLDAPTVLRALTAAVATRLRPGEVGDVRVTFPTRDTQGRPTSAEVAVTLAGSQWRHILEPASLARPWLEADIREQIEAALHDFVTPGTSSQDVSVRRSG